MKINYTHFFILFLCFYPEKWDKSGTKTAV